MQLYTGVWQYLTGGIKMSCLELEFFFVSCIIILSIFGVILSLTDGGVEYVAPSKAVLPFLQPAGNVTSAVHPGIAHLHPDSVQVCHHPRCHRLIVRLSIIEVPWYDRQCSGVMHCR